MYSLFLDKRDESSLLNQGVLQTLTYIIVLVFFSGAFADGQPHGQTRRSACGGE